MQRSSILQCLVTAAVLCAAAAAVLPSIPRVSSAVPLEVLREKYFSKSLPVVIEGPLWEHLKGPMASLNASYLAHIAANRRPPVLQGWRDQRISADLFSEEISAEVLDDWQPMPWADVEWRVSASAGWGGRAGSAGDGGLYGAGAHAHRDEVCFYNWAAHIGPKYWTLEAHEGVVEGDQLLLFPMYRLHGTTVVGTGWSINSPLMAAPGGRWPTINNLYPDLPEFCQFEPWTDRTRDADL